MAWAELVIDSSNWPLPPNLIPLAVVDQRSFACVVASDIDGPPLLREGEVVRWHIGLSQDRAAHQAALLDTDCQLYAESLAEELAVRQAGLNRMLTEVSPAYEVEYLDNDKRPRDFVLRPVRLACQNVVIGLAAFQHDSAIAGMSVPAWQTCEVPHVAAHEGNRAMAALMLCDAFKSGGTMEIRFDRRAKLKVAGTAKRSGESISVDVRYQGHPEMQVPASLRRYGRTVGVPLGQDELLGDSRAGGISPAEARQLFMAVTPMPTELRERVLEAIAAGVASPERLCFTLLAQVWREIELDFMLAVSPRTGSIISGGAPWTQRADRQAESEVARAALMVGMLFRRLDSTDHAARTDQPDEGQLAARVVEDTRVGVQWHVIEEAGAIRFTNLPSGEMLWQPAITPSAPRQGMPTALVAVPRSVVTSDDLKLAAVLGEQGDVVMFVLPRDGDREVRSRGSLTLYCPDRLAELDRAIERKLLNSRIARA